MELAILNGTYRDTKASGTATVSYASIPGAAQGISRKFRCFYADLGQWSRPDVERMFWLFPRRNPPALECCRICRLF